MLGFVAFALFGVIFFRLWYLQVLSGDQYLAQARDNQARDPAHRRRRAGEIVDRHGSVLVENEVATVVQLDPEKLPEAERTNALTLGPAGHALVARARAARAAPARPCPRSPRRELRRAYRRLGARSGWRADDPRPGDPLARAGLVLADHAADRRPRHGARLPARAPARFPGVHVERAYLRRYPQHELAAQLAGHGGGDRPRRARACGASGRRARHDRRQGRASRRPTTATCAARDGQSRITVDALGRPKRQSRRASPGRAARCSSRSTSTSSGPASRRSRRRSRHGPARPAAFVALDPRNGSVLAHGLRADASTRRSCRGRSRSALDQRARPGRRLAALQPRDRRRLSDRLDVQADHRAGRPVGRAHHARADDQRPGLLRDRRPRVDCNAGQGGQRDASTCRGRSRSPPTSSSTARPRPQPARGPAAAEEGAPARARPPDGHRPAGRGAAARARPPLARAAAARERRCRRKQHTAQRPA